MGREAALPDDADAAGRWSVDHLFVDQDALPTLVEVKRSSDTRIRREVVGQMLDYAANGVVYWPLEHLRELFARQCERDGQDPDLLISELVAEEADVEDFWTHVEENLRAGRVRMVFVSDEIPRELRRVVEFLNGQMKPAEVIAIEVKQYVGADGTRTLVPRVIGQTAEVEARKGRRASDGRQWDEEAWFAAVSERRPEDEARAARDLYDWSLARGWSQNFGSGVRDAVWVPAFPADGVEYYPLGLYPSGRIEVFFKQGGRPPFDDEQTRLELLRRFNKIPGVSFGPEVIKQGATQRAFFHPRVLADPAAFEELTRVFEWIEAEARKPA